MNSPTRTLSKPDGICSSKVGQHRVKARHANLPYNARSALLPKRVPRGWTQGSVADYSSSWQGRRDNRRWPWWFCQSCDRRGRVYQGGTPFLPSGLHISTAAGIGESLDLKLECWMTTRPR